MPTKIKLILSILVAAVAIGAYQFQGSLDREFNQWMILVLGAFMIFATWLFPETKGITKSGRLDKNY